MLAAETHRSATIPGHIVSLGDTAMLIVIVTSMLLVATGVASAADSGQPAGAEYTLQVLTAKPGKLDRVHEWLRQHRDDVLARHGATTIACLVPVENPRRDVLCLYRFPSSSAQAEFHTRLEADPMWRPLDASADGADALLEKIVEMSLSPTDYSPECAVEASANPRVFELRTYTCPTTEKLAFLHERFRRHTLKLFEKHGMQNLVYWNPTHVAGGDRKLIYLLGHTSVDAAKESFAAFRTDPEWLAAREASEQKAGGSLTEKEKGVVSEFFVATDYSPSK